MTRGTLRRLSTLAAALAAAVTTITQGGAVQARPAPTVLHVEGSGIDIILDRINTIGILEHPGSYFTVAATGAHAVTISETGRDAGFDAAVAAIPGIGAYHITHRRVLHSWRALDAVTKRIAMDRSALATSGVPLSWWGPDPTTDTVSVALAAPTGARAHVLSPATATSAATILASRYGSGLITVRGTTAPIAQSRSARGQDDSPYTGGDQVIGLEPCTSGFSVVRSSGPHEVLTAGHCGANSSGGTTGVLGSVNPANRRYLNGLDDFEAIDPQVQGTGAAGSTKPLVWPGAAGGTTTYRVLDVVIPAMTTLVTTDGWVTGLNNGERSGNTVTSLPSCGTFSDNMGGTHTVCDVQSSFQAGTNCQGGDSGGPVYVRTSPLGGAHAAGLIIASTADFSTCYWQTVSSIQSRGSVTVQVSHVTRCSTQPFPHSVCVFNEDGRQEVFWTGTSTTETNPGALMHQWQTSSGTWSGKASLGGSVSNWIDVGVNGDGRLEVFGQNSSHALQHMYQLAPNGVGGWHSFASLGCPSGGCLTSTTAPVVSYPGGQICVGGMRGADGLTHSIGQVMADGGWKAWDAGC